MTFITSSEAAKILEVTKRTLYRWENEGRVRVKREGILKTRIYDKSYIEILKQIIDLDKEEKNHIKKLPAIQDEVKKHLLMQDVGSLRAGEPMVLMDIEKASVAFDKEEEWSREHNEILRKLFSYPRDVLREILKI